MEWISVKDRLPEYGVIVLITDGEDVNAGSLNYSGKYPFKFIQDDVSKEFTDFSETFNENSYIPNAVTHWHPLPEPPKD